MEEGTCSAQDTCSAQLQAQLPPSPGAKSHNKDRGICACVTPELGHSIKQPVHLARFLGHEVQRHKRAFNPLQSLAVPAPPLKASSVLWIRGSDEQAAPCMLKGYWSALLYTTGEPLYIQFFSAEKAHGPLRKGQALSNRRLRTAVCPRVARKVSSSQQ